ncbi:F-box/LRR-repeat protein 8-like [Ciona intestinalis]
MTYFTWATMPQNILVDIFSYMSMNERLKCSVVCKWWNECLQHPKLWSRFMFKFDTNIDDEGKAIKCIESYCQIGRLSEVEIFVNPKQSVSRDRAMMVMEELRSSPSKKLQKFSFYFSGYNPLLFNGNELLSTMKNLFGSQPNAGVGVCHLTTVDLTECNISLDDEFVRILAMNHPFLRVVRIQNVCFVDNVTPNGLLVLVSGCPELKELCTFYHSIDDRVVAQFCSDFRTAVSNLSLICNAYDKYSNAVKSETWKRFNRSNPDAELRLEILLTTPQQAINKILCPDIPVTHLTLNVSGSRFEELVIIKQNCKQTLKCLTLQNDLAGVIPPPPGFEPALLDLIADCKYLVEINCPYPLSQDTISQIESNVKLVRFQLYLFNVAGNEMICRPGI